MIAVYTGPRHSGKTTRLAVLCREWRAAGRRVGGYLSVAIRPGRAAQDDETGRIELASLATGNRPAGAPVRGREDEFRGGAEGPTGYELLEIRTGARQPFLRRAAAVAAAEDFRANDQAEDRGHVPKNTSLGTCPPFSLPCSRPSFDARPGESRESVGRWIFVPGGLARAREIIRLSAANALLVVDEFGRLELEGGGVRPAFDESLRVPGRRVLVVVREALRGEFLKTYAEFQPATYNALQPGAGEDLARDLFGAAE